MKALFRFVFLSVVTTGLLLACADKDNNGAAYPGYPGYPPGYYPNAYYQPTFLGNSQIVNSDAYNKFIIGQFCGGKIDVPFTKWTIYDTCKLVNRQPLIELVVPDTKLTNFLTQARIVFHTGTKDNWYINGQNQFQYPAVVNLRRINNNTGFEGNFVDSISGTGFGGFVQIQGTGLPAEPNSAGNVQVVLYYNGVEMLRANLARAR